MFDRALIDVELFTVEQPALSPTSYDGCPKIVYEDEHVHEQVHVN